MDMDDNISRVDSSSSEVPVPVTPEELEDENMEVNGSISFLEKNYSKLNRNQKYKQKRSSVRLIPAPKFYINAAQTLNSEESTFAGRRDVTDPQTLRETRIISEKGTVRGYKNRVRAGIVTFLQGQESEEVRSIFLF